MAAGLADWHSRKPCNRADGHGQLGPKGIYEIFVRGKYGEEGYATAMAPLSLNMSG